MGPFRKYLAALAAGTVIPCAAVAVLDLLVDPDAVFPSVDLERFEPLRENGGRTNKMERLGRGGWEVLLFGTSRAMTSMDPRSPLWEGARAYDAGLQGTDLREIRRVFEFSLEHSRPRLAVVQVDLISFSSGHDSRTSLQGTRADPDLVGADYLLAHLLGWKTARRSLPILLQPDRGQGPVPGVSPEGFSRRPSPHVLDWARFTDGIGRYYFTSPETYPGFSFSRERLGDLEAILKLGRERDLRTVLMIPSLHAVQLEAMRIAGVWGDFERMKREVLAATRRAAAIPSRAPEPVLWDFTSFDGPAAEPVPDEPTPLRWYTDSAHPSAALGRVMLARVLGKEEGLDPDQRGFGVRLTEQDLDATLATLRAGREEFVRGHPREVARLEELFKATAARRAQLREAAGGPGGAGEGEGE